MVIDKIAHNVGLNGRLNQKSDIIVLGGDAVRRMPGGAIYAIELKIFILKIVGRYAHNNILIFFQNAALRPGRGELLHIHPNGMALPAAGAMILVKQGAAAAEALIKDRFVHAGGNRLGLEDMGYPLPVRKVRAGFPRALKEEKLVFLFFCRHECFGRGNSGIL